MKKIIAILNFVLIFGCTVASTEEEQVTEVLDKTIRMEITTLQQSDAVQISYYDYITDTYIVEQHIFDYDSSGSAIPKIITLTDYDFRYITGEIYRNNPIPVEISLKIYVDDELIIEESKTGDGSEYINISFNYDILKQENI
ncbi:hypothetical protein [Polaribacter sp. R77954]|uniref:hypothetical protein n=1 Tax=Polaribacter sp. R77954 TaxID=3093870 RepID=UPI0037C53E94